MEQRTDPVIRPIPAAGVDPAHVPGITPPPPGEPEEATADQSADRPDDAAVEDDDRDEPEEQGEDASASGSDQGPEPEEKPSDEAVEGPVFKVSDRRASITADRRGIRLRLDGEEAEFSWDEVGAVEIDTPRFGRRFSVTVYTTNRRWYENDVEAPARKLLKEWERELDTVLDACFEDGGE
ncbi:hypothetical protein AQ490_21435 [Wenjunlia vitaminophila]|uniref:Uncharacterized protein n=1 Tax=Wenjunlia vitaminophila TaxID=76728 RepID=A0A0T6LT43_WENVI|nr:hypothetical protein [Wenjunlia vitaminophila]KRV49172.1 hypothetical protein AQ490_21435 [Wenjunlia vitaminophila]